MRHPLWIVNSFLLTLLLIGIGVIFLTKSELPKRKKTTNQKVSSPPKKVEAIAVSKIYENDLFDTIKKPLPELEEPAQLQSIPHIPSASTPTMPPDVNRSLLPALNVALKGIMIINDGSKNIAIIHDNITSKEENYKVGDMIQDAQIVKIFPNRVILIRSNGQQEALYLTQKDAEKDPIKIQEKKQWGDVVRKKTDNHYLLDTQELSAAIPNLAVLIDLLQVTTVFKDGASIGCRITADPSTETLLPAAGLEQYDIITKINGLPITTFDERMHAFKQLQLLQNGAKITVELLRKKNPVTIEYTLVNLDNISLTAILKDANKEAVEKVGILEGPTPEELEEKRIAVLKEKYQFAPTMQEIMFAQKKAMLQEGQEQRLNDYAFSGKD